MKYGVISDIHLTFNDQKVIEKDENQFYYVNKIIEIANKYEIEKLFIIGDTTNNVTRTATFIELLNVGGLETYFILGNHEYWSRTYEQTQKLENKYYIHGKTVSLDNNHVFIGLDGMYDFSFIGEEESKGYNLPLDKEEILAGGRMYFDIGRHIIGDAAEVFEDMFNKLKNQLKENQGKNITVGLHYLPHKDFAIFTGDYSWDINNAFMGSHRYHELFVKYGVNKVFFGHTHRNIHEFKDGIEYSCSPVGYYSYEFYEPFLLRLENQLQVIDTEGRR